MIIVKAKNGDTFVNERKTQFVKHDKEQQEVTIYMENLAPIIISDVVTVYYMPGNRRKKASKNSDEE